jgi:hypothetical protein
MKDFIDFLNKADKTRNKMDENRNISMEKDRIE